MEKLTPVICLILIVVFLFFLFGSSNDVIEHKDLKVYKKGTTIIIEDSTRITFPDSITSASEVEDLYTVWHDGVGIEVDQKMIKEKPE